MRRELFPLMVLFWCAVILGVIVTIASFPKPMAIVAAGFTVAALIIAAAVTSEFRQP